MDHLKDITGADIRDLRLTQGLTLDEFWLPMKVTRSTGSNYELGRFNIGSRIRYLIWLHHVATAQEALEALGKTIEAEK